MFNWPRLSVAIIVLLLVMEPTLPSVLATYPSELRDTGFAIPAESASPTLAKSSSTLSSECSSSAPSGVLYEAPISLTNSQSSPTPSPFQQQLKIDSSLFSQYEASDLRNVEFYELDGSIIPSWLESGNSNSLMNTVYWLRLPNGIPALSTLTICMGFGASNLQFVNLGKTGEAPQLSGTYAQYDNGGTVFNFYDNFAGTALSSQWTTSYSCRQSGSTTYSCSPNQNCNSVGCSLDNVQISVNNGVKLTGPSGGVQGGMITTSSFSQPEFVDYYQLSYYSPGGSPSIIVEQSTGNLFGTDGFDYGYGPNVFSPTRADIQSFNDFNNGGTIFFGVNSGVGHMPSFSLPAVLSFAWMGTGSETGMVNYGSPASLADAANSFGPFYLSVLDSGGGNYAATGTLQWIRLRAVPPNGVMPACMLVAPNGTAVQCGGNQTATSVLCNSPVLRGSSTTCTVKVTGSSPTGDVSFSDGGTGGAFVPANAMCTLSSGVCSVSYSVSANFGIRTITATYLGDSNNAGSSTVFSLDVVQLYQSNTYINCLSNTVSVGQGTVCTAYVTGYNPATGTISWSQSSSNGGSVSFSGSSCQLNDGSCPITVTGSSSGAVSITANYGGDTNNLGSSYTTGQANSLTVTPGPPPPTIYSVTITSGNGGMVQWSYTANSGTVPSGHTSTFQVVAGVQFSLSAIPSDSQHYFQSWSAYGSVTQLGASASIILTATGDGGIAANFGTIASATLVTSVASGKGSISPNCPNGCSEPVGSTITVTAAPSSGWQFSSWSTQTGISCGSADSCSFVMPNNPATLAATFIQISTPSIHTVYFSQSGACCSAVWSVTLDGMMQSSNSPGSSVETITFNEPNGVYSYTVTPPPGFVAEPSSGNVVVNGGDMQVNVNFSQQATQSQYSVTISSGNGGSVSYSYGGKSGTVSSGGALTLQADSGTQISIKATPDSQHVFQSWSVTGSVSISSSSSSMTLMVNGNGGVSAGFASSLIVNVTPAGPSSIQLGQPIVFTASSSGGSGGYTYVWRWEQSGTTNQGLQNTGSSNQYTFAPQNAGSYFLWAVVTDSSENTNISLYTAVSVIGPTLPNPTITITPSTVVSGQEVRISGQGFAANSQLYTQIGTWYSFATTDNTGAFSLAYHAIGAGSLGLEAVSNIPSHQLNYIRFFPATTAPVTCGPGLTRCTSVVTFQIQQLPKGQGAIMWMCSYNPGKGTGVGCPQPTGLPGYSDWTPLCGSAVPLSPPTAFASFLGVIDPACAWASSMSDINPVPNPFDYLSSDYSAGLESSAPSSVPFEVLGHVGLALSFWPSPKWTAGLQAVSFTSSDTGVSVSIPKGAGLAPGTDGSSAPVWYVPSTVIVVVGLNSSVTWMNNDSLPHTVTDNSRLFDSGILYLNQSFTYTYSAPGTYGYHDPLHPWMSGTVIVRSLMSTSTLSTSITSAVGSQSSAGQTTTSSAPTSPQSTNPSNQCIIATAAYGSEMAPDVVYMRYVRDNLIGSTPTGKILRDAFNAFYYSWSPPLAQAIAGNAGLQAIFRVLLLPLVGIIHVTAFVFTGLGSGDFASIVAFTVAAALSVTTYIAAPTLTVWEVHKTNRRKKSRAAV